MFWIISEYPCINYFLHKIHVMIKAMIVDDEPKNLRVLSKLLNEFCPTVEIIAESANAVDAYDLMKTKMPELLFLDIEMPFGNGFDLLDRLGPSGFEIIFVTAFNEYAIKAFKYSALDYLLKPVNIEELKNAVTRAEEKIRNKSTNEQLKNFLHNLHKPDISDHKIAIATREGLMFLLIDKIMYCEANGGYTTFHTKSGEKLISSRNIKEYEDILPPKIFFRIHHSFIINLKSIARYHKGRGGYVEMENGNIIEVASRRKEEFLNIFGLK